MTRFNVSPFICTANERLQNLKTRNTLLRLCSFFSVLRPIRSSLRVFFVEHAWTVYPNFWMSQTSFFVSINRSYESGLPRMCSSVNCWLFLCSRCSLKRGFDRLGRTGLGACSTEKMKLVGRAFFFLLRFQRRESEEGSARRVVRSSRQHKLFWRDDVLSVRKAYSVTQGLFFNAIFFSLSFCVQHLTLRGPCIKASVKHPRQGEGRICDYRISSILVYDWPGLLAQHNRT